MSRIFKWLLSVLIRELHTHGMESQHHEKYTTALELDCTNSVATNNSTNIQYS